MDADYGFGWALRYLREILPAGSEVRVSYNRTFGFYALHIQYEERELHLDFWNELGLMLILRIFQASQAMIADYRRR